MFRHCFACHRFCWQDPIPHALGYSKDKHHTIPERYVCVRCTAVTFGPDIKEEAS